MSFIKKKLRTRTRPKQKLTAVQERSLLKIITVLVLCGLLWIFFAPGSGLITWMRKRAELSNLEKQNRKVEQENVALQKDIDRLRNDPAYLERVARKEHGLLKRNERVFDFSGKSVGKAD